MAWAENRRVRDAAKRSYPSFGHKPKRDIVTVATPRRGVPRLPSAHSWPTGGHANFRVPSTAESFARLFEQIWIA